MQDTGCKMQDAGCKPRVRVFEDKRLVPGSRCRGPAIWHLGPGTRHRSRSDAEGRIPSTEDRAKRAHGVCKMQDGWGLLSKQPSPPL
jgi:hypothetical protein